MPQRATHFTHARPGVEIPYEEVTFDSAGVNHTAWFTTFRRGSEDLLPRLREVMTRRHLESQDAGLASDELYAGGNERVRTELMRLTGYFHTESSHHASEYWPWFRKDAGLVQDYLPNRWDYFDICAAHSPDHNVDAFIEASVKDGLRPSRSTALHHRLDDDGERRASTGMCPTTA